MDETQFKEFFNTERLLDRSSLETGTKHIQLITSIFVKSKSKNWLIDATYLGNDNRVYFLLSSWPDGNEIKAVSFQKMQTQAISAVTKIIKNMIAQGWSTVPYNI